MNMEYKTDDVPPIYQDSPYRGQGAPPVQTYPNTRQPLAEQYSYPPVVINSTNQWSSGGMRVVDPDQEALLPSRFETPPRDCLAASIMVMLCCCLPLGIAALVYSLETRNAVSVGDMARAKKSAILARNLNISGLVIGAILTGIIIAVYVVVFSAVQTDAQQPGSYYG